MAKQDFQIHYKGQALEDGTMPVQELAPSLLALADVLQLIQKLENPNESTLSIDIQATKKGSFIVDLMLSNDLFKEAIDLFSGNESTAGANLLAYIGVFSGVIKLIKKLFGHKVKSVENESEGKVTIKLDDDTSITIPENHLRAYRDVEIRKSIESTLKPIKQDGVSSIEFNSKQETIVAVSEKDIDMFDAPNVKDETLEPSISEVYLQLVSVAFEHGKWKFSDGNTQFFATIEDKQFLENVEQNAIRFGSTDTLKVRLKNIQKRTDSGLKSEYFVEKVLEHHKGGKQLELDFEEKD
ncbi:hypothetical protein [Secundilactobacillus kimchicus]|uniref:hypothetical protein n=1 Tax=Secundilactobacillus kimchicus TaxID=528209 RepID=UPI0024A81089|nr:hypothetical protein [Secundilactobacillus kimchicus]